MPVNLLLDTCALLRLAEGRLSKAAADLPFIHRDPFDRVLVASALAHHLTILTSDTRIPQYPGITTLW